MLLNTSFEKALRDALNLLWSLYLWEMHWFIFQDQAPPCTEFGTDLWNSGVLIFEKRDQNTNVHTQWFFILKRTKLKHMIEFLCIACVASYIYVDHDAKAREGLFRCLQKCLMVEKLSPGHQRIYPDNGYLGGIVHELWRRAPFHSLPLLQPNHNRIWGKIALVHINQGIQALMKFVRQQGMWESV